MPRSRHDRCQIVRVGQRVPAAVGLAGAARLAVEVDVPGAGDVRGEVAVGVAAGERPPHVQQHRPAGAVRRSARRGPRDR